MIGPFLIRPISRALEAGVHASYLQPELKLHVPLMSSHLEKESYFSGKEFGASDIMMSFQVLAIQRMLGDKTPDVLKNWYEGITKRDSWVRTVQRVGDLTLKEF
jgi:glutathione S-transferase